MLIFVQKRLHTFVCALAFVLARLAIYCFFYKSYRNKERKSKLEFIERKKKIEDVNMLSPLVWAYIGDSVYEMFIRVNLVNLSNAKPHKLHIESIKYVKAKAQADILKKMEPTLTEKEKEIVRRGRNVQNHHVAKNADVADYAMSTAFEALIGYLYLTKQDDRLKEILNMCMV